MRYLLLTTLFLTACASSTSGAFHQAAPAYRPAPRPPMFTPGYSPNTPPEPSHTPAGAGLPSERMPGTVASSVPRSPNQRLLPRTDEPGVWAADGDPALSASTGAVPEIAGVPLPLAPDGSSMHARSCAGTVTEMLKDANRLDDLFALSPSALLCTVAHLFADCVKAAKHVDPTEYKVYGRNRARVIADVKAMREDSARADTKRAQEFIREACAGTTYDLTTVDFMRLKWEKIQRESR